MLGAEEAATLIAYLPPSGWQDVATKRDLDAAVTTLRGEFHEEMGQLRGEFGHLRGEFGQLRGEVTGLRGELRAEIRTQTRSLFLSLVGLQLTAAGLTVAASRLI